MDYSKILVDSESRGMIFPMAGEVERRHEALRSLLKELNIPVVLIDKVPDLNELWVTASPNLVGPQPGYIIFPAEGDYLSIQGFTLVEDGAVTKKSEHEGFVMFNEAIGGISYGDLELFMGDNRRIGITYPDKMLASVYDYLKRHLPDVELVDITDEFNALTAVKSGVELEAMEYVVDEHQTVMGAVPAMLTAGRLERDIVNEIRWQGLRHGVYGFNVWDGSHIELLSNPQDELVPEEDLKFPGRRVQQGDAVTLRLQFIGCNGYYGALGRCFTIGEATEQTKERYAAAVDAQDFAAARLVPGAKIENIGRELDEYLAARGYGKQTGAWIHAVGYYYFNAPNAFKGRDTGLAEGMLLAVQPEIYKNENDMRFWCDDLYVVTKDGGRRITGMSRELIQLGC